MKKVVLLLAHLHACGNKNCSFGGSNRGICKFKAKKVHGFYQFCEAAPLFLNYYLQPEFIPIYMSHLNIFLQ